MPNRLLSSRLAAHGWGHRTAGENLTKTLPLARCLTAMKISDLTHEDWQSLKDQLSLAFGEIAGLARCQLIKTRLAEHGRSEVAATEETPRTAEHALCIDLTDLNFGKLQTQLLAAVRIMAEARRKEIDAALVRQPGQRAYYLRNWP